MTSRRIFLFAVALVAGPLSSLSSCTSDVDAQPKAGRDADADLVARVTAIKDRMHVRYAVAVQITDTLARGELLQTQSLARGITALREDDVLPEWKPAFEAVRDAASRLERAKDLTAASRGLAELGGKCAACHEAAHARIKFDVTKPPVDPKDASLATRMSEHRWAIARMWDGLVGPSPVAWEAGATSLAAAPLTVTAASDKLPIGDDVARVRLYATRSAATKTTAARVGVYGDLLVTCAHCHAAVRDSAARP